MSSSSSLLASTSIKGDGKKSQAQLVDELTKKIQDIKDERRKMAEEGQYKSKSKKKREPYKPILKPPLHHPSLEYIFGQVLYSPYLTSPLDAYNHKTLKGIDELNELKNKGYANFKDIPDDLRPYDPKEAKKEFIKEILNYNPSPLATSIQGKGGKKKSLYFEESAGSSNSSSIKLSRSQSESNFAYVGFSDTDNENSLHTTSSMPTISMSSINSSADLYRALSPPSSLLLQVRKTKDVHNGFAAPPKGRPNSRKIDNRSSRNVTASSESSASSMFSLFSSSSSKELLGVSAGVTEIDISPPTHINNNRKELGAARNGRNPNNNRSHDIKSNNDESKYADTSFSQDFSNETNSDSKIAEKNNVKESASNYNYDDDFEDTSKVAVDKKISLGKTKISINTSNTDDSLGELVSSISPSNNNNNNEKKSGDLPKGNNHSSDYVVEDFSATDYVVEDFSANNKNDEI